MAPITHKLQPDASMPRCRSLSGFIGKRCLADQTPDPPSSKASQKHLRKRSALDGAPVADPSTFTSQLSIIKLLSQCHSKRDPSVQSFGYGLQILTAETQEERVQIGGDNPRGASSCGVSVLHAVPSEESHFLDVQVSQNLSEQMIMAQHLRSLGDEITELSCAQSAKVNVVQEPLETHKLDVSEPLISEVQAEDDKVIDWVVDRACSRELEGSQDRALVLELQSSGSSELKQDLWVDQSSKGCAIEAAKIQSFNDNSVTPLIDRQQQAQPLCKGHVSPALQSPQAQESFEMVHLNLGTCQELCVVNTNFEELKSLACVTLPQNDGNETYSCIGKPDSDTSQVDVSNSLAVMGHVQGCMEEKSLPTCQQNKPGHKLEGDLRRSSRIKKLFNTGEDIDSMNQKMYNDCHKHEHEASKLVVSGSLHDNRPKSTQSEFFFPASKKSKNQKLSEETSIPVLDKPGFREKRPREEKGGLAQKGIAGISSKQATSNDDFFKPTSKRQKKILNATTDGWLNSMTKEEKGEKISDFEFDLWTEAKIAAEENAQLGVGKPTHPFFSQHKGGQRASIVVSLAANDCSSQPGSSFEEMELTPSPPFHITQLPEVEVHTINLERWTSLWICRNRKMDPITFKRESFDRNRKDLDSLLRVSSVKKLSKTPKHRRDYTSGGLLPDNDLEPLLTFLKDFEDSSEENLDQEKIDFSLAYLEDRLMLCLSDRSKRCSEVSSDMIFACTDERRAHKNLLWTDLYQPQSPKQVCGNRDSVNSLNTWLEKWQAGSSFVMGSVERGAPRKKMSSNEDSDEDQGCFQEDSDSEGSAKEDASSQNVIFLAGPVGCGKTAAIYACARAHGFTVIEVNCSDNRNGLLIKQKFSESMESHRLGKWSADTTVPPSCTTTRDTLAAAGKNIAENIQHASSQKRRNQKQKQKPMNDLTSTSKLSNSKAVHHTDAAPVLQAEQHDGSKECDKSLTVLLFEDVDMVFEDDRGFIAAVAQLAATAKRPIILTSNDKQLCLPHRLGADLLEFKKPSTKELVVLTYLICVAEGTPCRPEILLQMVKLFHHDLRLLLNYLQFWSQGHISECSSELEDMQLSVKSEKELELQSALESQEVDSAATTKLFELEAQHRLWPSCVSLEFPCPVTQSVACELKNKVYQVERECDLEEERKLQYSILEKLALIKKLKRQKVDSPSRAEREDVSNDLNGLTAEESDSLETPVKNLKDAKAVARSPILREKLKKDLATTMFGPADIKEHLNENQKPVLETPIRHQSGEDDHSNAPLAGPDVLGSAVSTVAPSIIGAVKAATSPCLQPSEHEVDREPLSNDADVETESMRHNVFTKASSKTLTPNIQSSENLRCYPDESKLQRISESINTMWSEFRHMKEKQNLLLSSESLATTSFILELSENLSICDMMSCLVSTEEMDLETVSCLSSCCESLESSNVLQACSMVAHKSLLLCIEQCMALPSIQETAKTKLSCEDMMLAVNDPCALGKLVTDDNLLPSSRGFKLQNIAPLSQEQEFKRREKNCSLRRALYDELPSKAHSSLQRASFFENVSFLARIGLLERERLNSGGTRRRGRGFQNYFRTHPWNLSKESTNIIEKFGKFGSSRSADL